MVRTRHSRANDHFGLGVDTSTVLDGAVDGIPDGTPLHDALLMLESGGLNPGQLTPPNWASSALGTEVWVPDFATDEKLTGETVFVGGSGPPVNPQWTNDRGGIGNTHMNETVSERPSFAGSGTINYWWGVNFGEPIAVTAFRIWPPPGGPRVWEGPGSQFTNLVEWSDDGTNWVSTPYNYSTAVVSSGNSFPYATVATEHRYVLQTIGIHQWWRIRHTGSFGLKFFVGDGLSNWYVDGYSLPVWVPGPLANDTNPDTFEDAYYGATCLRIALDEERPIYEATIRMSFATGTERTYTLYGTNQADWSELVPLDETRFYPAGSDIAEDIYFDWVVASNYRYFVLVGPNEGRHIHEVTMHALTLIVTRHPLATNRDLPEQHPATAVSFDDSLADMSANTAQGALIKLANSSTLGSGVAAVIAHTVPGVKMDFELPFTGTITEVRLLADPPGNAVVDLWKETYANFPPTVADSICGSTKPTLSNAAKYRDSTLTGWTTDFVAGDIIRVYLESADYVVGVTLDLRLERQAGGG